jgi:organic hydroperoxide reductase OsmC/OhrA
MGFTSPAEMLAGAIASSMSRMVALEMAKTGIKPVQVETNAVLRFDFVGEALRILGAQLRISARTSSSECEGFEQAVECARRECPIASVLNLDIQCEAKLLAAPVPALV